MTRRFWMIPLVVMLAAPAALGQEVRKLEPVVVTATKVETPQERLGTSVTVITEEELRAYNYHRVEDALRSVPGVEVQRSGGPGKLTSVTIRGHNVNQVQVLVDGMRVKSPTLGSFDFADLSLDAIERIEVIRGPQSTLHGADAIGGVINIITKKGAGPPSGVLEFEGGSHQTFREQGAFQAGLGRWDLSLSGSRLDTRGQQRTFDNDDSEQTAFAGRVGVWLPWDASVGVTGRYSKSEIDTPVNVFLNTRDPDSQQQTEFYLYTLSYAQTLTPWWTVSARMGQMWNKQGFQNGPAPITVFGPDFAFISQFNTRRREFEVLSTWHMGKVNSLTLGLEHRNEGVNTYSDSADTFRVETNTRSLFLQDELRFFDRLFLGGGVRFEDSDAFGGVWTPRLSLAYLLKETGTKLRGGYGKGFRAPTLNDLFFPSDSPLCSAAFSNPTVQPEKSKSWEAGVDQALWTNRIAVALTYFHTSFKDLITPVNIPPTPLGALFGVTCQQQSNAGRAHTEGLEFSVRAEPFDWLLLEANYTWTDGENDTTGQDLLRVAAHRWNAGVTVTPIPRLSFFLQSHVVSRQFDGPFTNRHNPGYHRIDAGGTVRLLQRTGPLEKLDFTVRVQNLTDNTYSEAFGFPALGFTALAGLRAYFR